MWQVLWLPNLTTRLYSKKWLDGRVRQVARCVKSRPFPRNDETFKLLLAAEHLPPNPYSDPTGLGTAGSLEVTISLASARISALNEKARKVNIALLGNERIGDDEQEVLRFRWPIVDSGSEMKYAELPSEIFYRFSACTRDTYDEDDPKAFHVFNKGMITLVDEWIHGKGNEDEW